MSDETIDNKPPEGMRTVMFNNKAVGYVPHTGDPNENARLAKELLIEKGLWKEKSTIEAMYGQAVSFAHASNYLYENDLRKKPRNPRGIAPFIVNASFSAEMYLKCLKTLYGEVPKETHTLTALFKQLPNKLKDKINKKKKQLEIQHEVKSGVLFKEHLKHINNAFINWRYIYEKESDYVNIPTTIFILHVLHEVTVEHINIET